jgi:hypothetical protein
MRRRHPDVHDRDIGSQRGDALHELGSGGRDRDDIEPDVREEAGEPQSEEDLVLRDLEADGLSA